jgi:membrane-bound metal-dependent hydrolase YbcI (DUF457 family)
MPFDTGIGLILGVLLNSNTELNLLLCLIIGIFASLLPDLDFVYKYLKTQKVPTTEHRDGLHYPLLVVPIAGAIGWLFNPEIGIVLAIGTLIHFLHDSIGIGFGVKWLFPFKKNSYLFLFQIKTPNNLDMPKKRLYSLTDKERAVMISKYGYNDWIRFVYLKPNPWGMFEYSVLIIGIIVLLKAV